MTQILAFLIAAVTTLSLAAPAHAAEPQLYAPLTTAAGDVPTVVRVDAPRLSWGARAAARRWDALLPGLTIETGACVEGVPCVRVMPGSWDTADQLRLSEGTSSAWRGLTAYPQPDLRLVFLNRASSSKTTAERARTAMHEIGHALGLAHHDNARGVMPAYGHTLDPSTGEVEALNNYYTQGATS